MALGGALARLGRWIRVSGMGQRLGAWVGAVYVRLVLATTRWEVRGRAHYDSVLARGGGVIGATWHGRLCLAPFWAPPGRKLMGMISANRDGELIAGVLARFGVIAIRGSSYDRAKSRDKGGARALAEAEVALAAGAVLVITPDGPRGPLMRAQPGVAALSIRTGVPVCPIAFATRRGRVLGSWDQFLMPFPFGRGVQIAGPVLEPPLDGDGGHDTSPETVEAYRLRIEDALTAVMNEADLACGRTPIEPA